MAQAALPPVGHSEECSPLAFESAAAEMQSQKADKLESNLMQRAGSWRQGSESVRAGPNTSYAVITFTACQTFRVHGCPQSPVITTVSSLIQSTDFIEYLLGATTVQQCLVECEAEATSA